MFLQGLQCPEASLTQAAHGGSPDHMVLRMKLQLLHGLEGQAALVATVLVHVAIRNRQLWPLVVNFVEMHLQRVGGLKHLITAFLPAQEPRIVFFKLLVL